MTTPLPAGWSTEYPTATARPDGHRIHFELEVTTEDPDKIAQCRRRLERRLMAATDGKRVGTEQRVREFHGEARAHSALAGFFPSIKLLRPSDMSTFDQLRRDIDADPNGCVLIGAGVEVRR